MGTALAMIIDCHGHYTTAPAALEAWRKRQVAALDDPAKGPTRAELVIADDEIRDEPRERATEDAARTRHGPHDLLAARELHGAPHRHRGDEPRMVGDLQRPRRARLRPLSRQLRRRLPAAAVAGRAAGAVHPRARALRQRARLHRLQPEPRSVGRALEGAAADRPLVVPALREDGRARRAGDGPRVDVVQPVLPRDGRALHQRRHDGVHAVPDRRPVQGFSDAEVHHPARRRRGALPLGPLPRARAGHEASAACRSCC